MSLVRLRAFAHFTALSSGTFAAIIAASGYAHAQSTDIAAGLTANMQQSGTVIGQVYSPTTEKYMRDATIQAVFADGSRRTAVSGDRGEFRLTDVPAGTAELTVSFTGYRPAKQILTVRSGETSRPPSN